MVMIARRISFWTDYCLALPRVWSPPKRFVVVLCSMRSGSTLLNALLAQAPDISHLPETRWDKYLRRINRFDRRAENLSGKEIIVFKSPPWLRSTHRDKEIVELPVGESIKLVLLVRDAYGVIKSLDKLFKGAENEDRLIKYWCEAYESASVALTLDPRFVHVVKYEDLVAQPKTVTRDLFEFIGSVQSGGVDSYAPPRRFEWAWGESDASDAIKSLVVRRDSPQAPDVRLEDKLRADPLVSRLRRLLGYPV